jgi:hypothetical protein
MHRAALWRARVVQTTPQELEPAGPAAPLAPPRDDDAR